MLLLSAVVLLAQERTVSGKVTDSSDGSGIPGANVLLKNTTSGVVTDANGDFKISVPASGGVLQVSFIGFAMQEIPVGTQTTINVSLQMDVTQLSEVVVTALNVPREKKTLGYATQTLSSDNMRVARETNLNSALAGKVAGVQVISSSGAKFGEASVRIRGIRGMSGSAPLYVLDGIVISDFATVNMDNVASISVLKGANAAALYGIRATDGVVMITSKSGTEGKLDISFNNTTMFENVSLLPEFQDEYGGGYSDEHPLFAYDPTRHAPELAGLDGKPMAQFYADESWGPKLDGTQVAQWDAFTPGTDTYGQTRPWLPQPNNIRDFFETGTIVNNSFSVSKAAKDYNISVTATDIRRGGILPDTDQSKTFLNLKTKVWLTDKIRITGIANYNKTVTNGNLDDGYNSTGASFLQWHQRQMRMDLLDKYWLLPNGSHGSWNINGPLDLDPLYWDSPYTTYRANRAGDEQDSFIGSANLEYEIVEGLQLSVGVTRDQRAQNSYSQTATGTVNRPDGYGTSAYNFREDNISATLNYTKQLSSDISLSALAGYNLLDRETKFWSMSTAGGLTVPNLYNLSASTDRPNVSNSISRLQVRSIFASANVGFREIVYVDGLYRIDHTSGITDPERNGFKYFQGSGSFIFSEVLPENNILSFGKLRGSISETGKMISPYYDQTNYGLGTPYGSLSTMSEPNTIIDPQLSAITTVSQEIGLELKFLQNRVTLDFSVYNYNTTDEPLSLTLPGELGASAYRTNSGEFNTNGWEISIGGTPVETPNFRWETNFNFSSFDVKVESLDKDGTLAALTLSNGFNGDRTWGGWSGITAKVVPGEKWGTLYGSTFDRHENGERIVGANGLPLYSTNQKMGSILPDAVGGIYNTFDYKNFQASFTIDWQIGGYVSSISRGFMQLTGIAAATAGLNDKGNPKRDDPADGGGVLFKGVYADGSPNTTYVDVHRLGNHNFSISEAYTYKASFVKLREVRIGYNFPKSMLGNLPISRLSVGAVANNPLLIWSAIGGGIDPSEVNGDTRFSRTNAAWVEAGNLPPTRTMGFDIKVGF
jgi:TonB-linked SusC/RagA family outer membrane protein